NEVPVQIRTSQNGEAVRGGKNIRRISTHHGPEFALANEAIPKVRKQSEIVGSEETGQPHL
ncbi:MAG TPA: hypothetical protein VHM88_21590, partial [Candidatus Acidoferrales bacterium]|nr:hypothetical protein [Candidatus Acidoferrales bacterium]